VMAADPPKDLTTKEGRTAGGAASPARYRYTRFSVYDLSLPVDSPIRAASRIAKPETDLTLGQLHEKILEFRHDAYSRAPFQVEYHKRFALPLAALVFGLVAFPLAVRSHRGGRSFALLGSLVILVTYYLLMTSLEGAALGTRIPAWVAIWTPNILFTAIGLGLLVWRASGRADVSGVSASDRTGPARRVTRRTSSTVISSASICRSWGSDSPWRRRSSS